MGKHSISHEASPLHEAQNSSTAETMATQAGIAETPVEASWLKRHRAALGLIGFGVAGVVAISHPHDIEQAGHDIADHFKPAAAYFAATESLAWLGAGAMLASAGTKVGNPLTVKSRLKDVRTQLSDTRLYRTGWSMGAVGAVGTSVGLVGGAIATLPEASWPLAAEAAVLSLVVSTIPFKPVKQSSVLAEESK